MTETKNVCVTGGAGFIGSHLVEALVREGHSVTVLDNFAMGRPESLQVVEDDIRMKNCSVLDLPALRERFRSADIVYHFAALLGVQRVFEQPLEIIDSIVGGTRNVFRACHEQNVPRVVYASSSEVYGNTGKVPYSEDSPVSPISCYAASKLLAEKIAESYHVENGIDYTCLRFFNAYGPRQNSSKYGFIVARFLDSVRNNRPPVIYGDGRQTRDFTYIDDVVDCILLASGDMGRNNIFNVGSGAETSIIDLFKTIATISGNNILPAFAPSRPNEILRRVANIQKAQRLLGYEPKISLESGLRKTLAYHESLPDTS